MFKAASNHAELMTISNKLLDCKNKNPKFSLIVHKRYQRFTTKSYHKQSTHPFQKRKCSMGRRWTGFVLSKVHVLSLQTWQWWTQWPMLTMECPQWEEIPITEEKEVNSRKDHGVHSKIFGALLEEHESSGIQAIIFPSKVITLLGSLIQEFCWCWSAWHTITRRAYRGTWITSKPLQWLYRVHWDRLHRRG